jgi:hypothetical protein
LLAVIDVVFITQRVGFSNNDTKFALNSIRGGHFFHQPHVLERRMWPAANVERYGIGWQQENNWTSISFEIFDCR